jgi:hypothetical protein
VDADASPATKLRSGLLEVALGARRDRDSRAGIQQPFADAETDPSRTARHEGDSALQVYLSRRSHVAPQT